MYAGDGNHTDETLRWSSENDWENNDHWLMADFGEPVSIGAVRIYWERTNAKSYALEYSQDKENWQQASVFEEAPEQKEQQIVLNEPVEARYFRLHVTDVLKEESDLSLYYQNVSVQELEVYGQLEDCFVVETPVIEAGSRRTLELPTVPEPYSISFGGADYDVLVNMDGKSRTRSRIRRLSLDLFWKKTEKCRNCREYRQRFRHRRGWKWTENGRKYRKPSRQ